MLEFSHLLIINFTFDIYKFFPLSNFIRQEFQIIVIKIITTTIKSSSYRTFFNPKTYFRNDKLCLDKE